MTFVSSGFLGLAMNLDNSTIYQNDPFHTKAPTIFYLTPAIIISASFYHHYKVKQYCYVSM